MTDELERERAEWLRELWETEQELIEYHRSHGGREDIENDERPEHGPEQGK